MYEISNSDLNNKEWGKIAAKFLRTTCCCMLDANQSLSIDPALKMRLNGSLDGALSSAVEWGGRDWNNKPDKTIENKVGEARAEPGPVPGAGPAWAGIVRGCLNYPQYCWLYLIQSALLKVVQRSPYNPCLPWAVAQTIFTLFIGPGGCNLQGAGDKERVVRQSYWTSRHYKSYHWSIKRISRT